jgi:hypothetical protein
LRNKLTVINNQNHIVAHKGHGPHLPLEQLHHHTEKRDLVCVFSSGSNDA